MFLKNVLLLHAQLIWLFVFWHFFYLNSNMYMYDHRVHFKYMLFKLCNFNTCKEIVQLVCIRSSFLHIVIRHNVDFCTTKLTLNSATIFRLIFFIADDVIKCKTISISFENKKTRESNHLKRK